MRKLILGRLKNEQKMCSQIDKIFAKFREKYDEKTDIIFIYVSDWAGENGVKVVRDNSSVLVLLNEKLALPSDKEISREITKSLNIVA